MPIKSVLSILFIILSIAVSPARAAGNLSVNEQVVLNASADQVWKVIGGFGTLDTWHPGVVKEVMTGSGTRPGDTRVLTLQNGGTVTEVLVDHDDHNRKYSYTIKQSPLPVSQYLSTLKVLPMGKDLARVVWSATFNARGVPDKQAMDAVRGIYASGFKGLAEHFK